MSSMPPNQKYKLHIAVVMQNRPTGQQVSETTAVHKDKLLFLFDLVGVRWLGNNLSRFETNLRHRLLLGELAEVSPKDKRHNLMYNY